MNIIAEAGLNWTNFTEAIEYIEVAKECGADYVKYQWVYNPDLPQLTPGEWRVIKWECDRQGIGFMVTPSYRLALEYLVNWGKIDVLKVGADRASEKELNKDIELIPLDKKPDVVLVSNGWWDNELTNMYCVSVYPCPPEYYDFKEAGKTILNEAGDPKRKYIGFSDHTLEYGREWTDKINAVGFEWYEKHISLHEGDIDRRASLNPEQFKALVSNLKGGE